MRIAFFGDGPWAHGSFDALRERGHELVCCVVRFDQRDPVLVEKADQAGIPLFLFENVNAAEALEKLMGLGADLGVSMSFNQIVRGPLRELFPQGFINVHAGALPRYRGRNILNWALINGETEIGVTCHYIDDGIDTGDIIVQRSFAVEADDTYRTVLEKAFVLCPEVLVEAVEQIGTGEAERRAQPELGTYFSGRGVGDEWIDWQWDSRRVVNFVRALCDPGPRARTVLRTPQGWYQVAIERAGLLSGAPCSLGENGCVIGRSGTGNPLVKTGDSYIELIDYQIVSAPRKKLRIGDRLGVRLMDVVERLGLVQAPPR